MTGREEALAAASVIRERVAAAGYQHLDAMPVAGIVLGSGLGGLAARVAHAARIPYAHIPGFAPSTVHGHAGELLVGELAGRPVVLQAGRFHLYEGHDAATAAFPVRVMHALGVRTLVVSNAAGGVRRTFRPGDLMVIADHINLMFRNPLTGPLEKGDERFPDMSDPYDPALRRLLHAIAASQGLALQEGVYAGLLGPTYETPSEVRMLEKMGADAVGMSTVPEVTVARALGMRVAGISCITNPAAGISHTPLHHGEVLKTSARVAKEFEGLVEAFVAQLR
ncbi:MAG: purine-nucleoside phosphorylase [Gemmatimonadaceae bacterium]|jgi:purine-nucleoside phosphorylase|nr:purine-nucleoside phosphorylase [Gemmatimonadaceae bacterium]